MLRLHVSTVQDLPAGARVFLEYKEERRYGATNVAWGQDRVIELNTVDGRTFNGQLELATPVSVLRGDAWNPNPAVLYGDVIGNEGITSFSYVFRIEPGDGSVGYENGSPARWDCQLITSRSALTCVDSAVFSSLGSPVIVAH